MMIQPRGPGGRVLWVAGLLAASLSGCAASRPASSAPRYVFAWPFIETSDMAPRGGTTKGEEVRIATGPSAAWKTLQQPGLSKFERDRAAILAMAGDYRASFDFLETVVFEPPHLPAKPYRSWGTERVYVVEDRGDEISLQHILEMVFLDEDGNRQGPVVQKHWRQDWVYEPASVHEYVGRRHWTRRAVGANERRGAWSQSVYQVDDTPRYASVGRWEHDANASVWTGSETGRPLPRRESSVRDDYDLLVAVNRHTILPNGWTHEEDNLKTVLGASRGDASTAKAREMGVNRYERLADFDFDAADAYWEATGPLWAEVRRQWRAKLAASSELDVATTCDGTPVFVSLFTYGQKYEEGSPPPPAEMREDVATLLDCITR